MVCLPVSRCSRNSTASSRHQDGITFLSQTDPLIYQTLFSLHVRLGLLCRHTHRHSDTHTLLSCAFMSHMPLVVQQQYHRLTEAKHSLVCGLLLMMWSIACHLHLTLWQPSGLALAELNDIITNGMLTKNYPWNNIPHWPLLRKL